MKSQFSGLINVYLFLRSGLTSKEELTSDAHSLNVTSPTRSGCWPLSEQGKIGL